MQQGRLFKGRGSGQPRTGGGEASPPRSALAGRCRTVTLTTGCEPYRAHSQSSAGLPQLRGACCQKLLFLPQKSPGHLWLFCSFAHSRHRGAFGCPPLPQALAGSSRQAPTAHLQPPRCMPAFFYKHKGCSSLPFTGYHRGESTQAALAQPLLLEAPLQHHGLLCPRRQGCVVAARLQCAGLQCARLLEKLGNALPEHGKRWGQKQKAAASQS